MITPQEARLIADEHPDKELLDCIKKVENDIEDAAKKGRYESLLYAPYWLEDEVAEFFRRNGWDVRQERRFCGGVLQNPAYYIRW